MLHARYSGLRHTGRSWSVLTSGAEAVDGVKVLRDGDFIAVVSENRDLADLAVVRINAEYAYDELKVNDLTLFDYINRGEYRSNEVASAGTCLKHHNCVTNFLSMNTMILILPMPLLKLILPLPAGRDKLTVWASTQSPFGLQDTLVRSLEQPLRK